jgi:molybdenum cofactor synthesis domain-containing protein
MIPPKAKKRSYRVGILILSDKGARGERKDSSGPLLKKELQSQGYEVADYRILPDDYAAIVEALRTLCDEKKLDLVITSGGTGVSPRDVTPEATIAVLHREIPGLAEAMRRASFAQTPHALLSRAIAGNRGTTLIVNLPGSPKGAMENLQVILPALPHALAKIQGDPADCAS